MTHAVPRPRTRRIYAAWLSVLVLPVIPATADSRNWPSFRGPNGSGVGAGTPPTTWNVETGENVKWKVPIPGLGHSSPIVWGDRIFLTTAVCQADSEPSLETGWLGGTGDSAADKGEWVWKVMCLDRDSGRTLWERDAHRGVPRQKRHLKASHANCTPATDGRHVVAFFASEGLHCYDVDGQKLWSKDLGVIASGPYNAEGMEWGFASSPIIHDGQVILQCDALNGAYWAALDVKTGQERRRVQREEVATWCTPAILSQGGRTQVVLNGWKCMAGYDLASGERLWHLSGGGDVPVPTPQIAHGLIFLTNGHGRSPIYAIKPEAHGDLTPKDEQALPEGLAWYKNRHGSYMPTPIVVGDKLCVASDNGILTCFDARTGEQRFRERVFSGATASASPVAAQDKLYIPSEDGAIYVLKCGDSLEKLATNEMKDICMATPAISDGRLLIRTRRHLYCLGS